MIEFCFSIQLLSVERLYCKMIGFFFGLFFDMEGSGSHSRSLDHTTWGLRHIAGCFLLDSGI